MSHKVGNPPFDICTKRRLKSACASMQSHQSSLSAWGKFASLSKQNTPSEDVAQTAREYIGWSESPDQTVQICRLIWIFAGCTCSKDLFLTFLLRSWWNWTKIWDFFQTTIAAIFTNLSTRGSLWKSQLVVNCIFFIRHWPIFGGLYMYTNNIPNLIV